MGQNFDNLKCNFAGCTNPKGDHNGDAHETFGNSNKDYTSGKKTQRQGRSESKGASTRKSSKSPAKYSRQNSQNREVVAKNKEDATISSIGVDLMTPHDIEDLGSGSDTDFDFNPRITDAARWWPP